MRFKKGIIYCHWRADDVYHLFYCKHCQEKCQEYKDNIIKEDE